MGEGNSIGDDGANSIGDSLKTNSALTYLSLHHNKIGDTGAKSIGEGLKLNRTLVDLRLYENKFSKHGCKILNDIVDNSSTLKCLAGDSDVYLLVNGRYSSQKP